MYAKQAQDGCSLFCLRVIHILMLILPVNWVYFQVFYVSYAEGENG